MSCFGFNVGDKVELLSVDVYDKEYNLKVGDKGVITSLDSHCNISFPNILESMIIYYDQIKLVESDTEEIKEIPQAEEKYVKCIDNTGFAEDNLKLDKIYKVTGEGELNYELANIDRSYWRKDRFIEIPNPQNPVKSSVSEPLKSNKMELLRPVLDIVERLQELEVDKDNIEEMIARIESDEAIESSNRWYELKIQELEYENSKLQKENVDLYSYITKISEMTRTCIIDRLKRG